MLRCTYLTKAILYEVSSIGGRPAAPAAGRRDPGGPPRGDYPPDGWDLRQVQQGRTGDHRGLHPPHRRRRPRGDHDRPAHELTTRVLELTTRVLELATRVLGLATRVLGLGTRVLGLGTRRE